MSDARKFEARTGLRRPLFVSLCLSLSLSVFLCLSQFSLSLSLSLSVFLCLAQFFSVFSVSLKLALFPPLVNSALSALFRAFSALFSALFPRKFAVFPESATISAKNDISDSALSALFPLFFRPHFFLAFPVALLFRFAPRRFALGAAHRTSA